MEKPKVFLSFRAAVTDITPSWPVPLGGYSGSSCPFVGIRSRLEAQASLIVSADGVTVLVVSFDLLYVGARLRDHILAWASQHGIEQSAVWLAASHTHFAPATDKSKPALGAVDDRYMRWLLDQVSQLLDRVLSAEAGPVSVEFSRLPWAANVNRRRRWRWPTLSRRGVRLSGATVMAPAPNVPCDSDLVVVRFVDSDGRCLGVWWKYACHPVGCPDTRNVNAEFPGRVRDTVRSTLACSDLPVMFMQGFAGDVRPNIAGTTDTRGVFRRLRSGPSFGQASIDQWSAWANGIAQAVAGMWRAGQWCRVSPSLRADSVSLALSELLSYEKTAGTTQENLVIQRMVFGDRLELIGGNAEFCSPWLRWGTPGMDTIHVGYLGDVFGYLPSETQVRYGGYEVEEFMKAFGIRGYWLSGYEARLDALVATLAGAEEVPTS